MYDCEMMQMYDEKLRVAKKPHVCCECRKRIQPGEKYWACSGMCDGEFSTMKQHVCCYEFSHYVNLTLQLAGQYECIAFGDIKEFLWGCDYEAHELYHEYERLVSGCCERFEVGTGI